MNKFDYYTIFDMACMIIIYLTYFLPKWNKKGTYELFIKTAFYIYFTFVLYFTLIIPFIIPLPMLNIQLSSLHCNFIPYLDLINGYAGANKEVLLNILMLIPFGILVPFIYKKSFFKTICLSFLFSLSIETIQLFSVRNISACDITDIINNVFGAIVGYGIYLLFYKNVDKLLNEILPKQPLKIVEVSTTIKKILIISMIILWIIRSIII